MRRETVIIIDDNELNSIIGLVFDISYEFAAETEANNDSCYMFNVSKDVTISKDNCFDEYNYSLDLHIALSYMANMGFLPVGTLIVEVCW